MRRRQQPESAMQRAVCQHLRARPAFGLVWFAVPNGGLRSAIEASIMKGLGVRAGVSDLFFLHGGKAYMLELKAPGRKPNDSQTIFMRDFNKAGGESSWCDDLDVAIRWLEERRLLRGHSV